MAVFRFLAAMLFFAAGAVQAQQPVQVELKHLDESDEPWELVYRFPSGQEAVAFSRSSNIRQGRWRVVSPGIVIQSSGGRDYLVAERGANFRTVIIRLSVDTRRLSNDYEFFQTFSDGGMVVFTGHLSVSPATVQRGRGYGADALNISNRFWPQVLTLQPRRDEGIVYNGQQSRGKVTGELGPNGTYAYFGSRSPERLGQSVALIDLGTPGWVKQQVRSFFPRVVQYYESQLDIPLNSQPMVILNMTDTNKSGFSYSGGALPGLVQLTLAGSGWDGRDEDNFELLVEFIAHEAAHLWNSGLVINRDQNKGSYWIHEGAADAFAYRAMTALGVINLQRYNERLSLALNRCAQGVANQSLRGFSSETQIGNAYSCGSTIGLLTEAALRRTNSRRDLFDFWQALIEQAQSNNGFYDEAMYFSNFQRLTGDSATRQMLDGFVSAVQTDPSAMLLPRLRATGINVGGEVGELPERQRRFLSFEAVKAVADFDCGGRSNVNYRKSTVRISGSSRCRNFVQGSYHIVSAGGETAYEDAAGFYDYIQNGCGRGRVSLTTRDGQTLTVDCRARLAPRQPWLAINGYSAPR